MEKQISHLYSRMAKRARTGLGPSTPGEPALEAPVATLTVKETVAMAVESATGATVGRAAIVEASTTAAEVVAVAAEAGMASGEAMEVGPAAVEVMVMVTEVVTSGDATRAEVATGVAGDDAMVPPVLRRRTRRRRVSRKRCPRRRLSIL